MRARVPTAIIDNTYEAFPEGHYNGKIVGAELRDPNRDGSWLILKLAAGDVTPKEGTPNPGRGAFSGDITLKSNGIDLFEIADFSDTSIPYPIRLSAGLLAGLAEVLGVGDRSNGAVETDLKAFTTALLDGQFQGEAVGFSVKHWSKADGTPRDQFGAFGAAG